MQKIAPGKFLYAATDVVNFLECEHLTTLDLLSFEQPMQKAKDDEQAVLIQEKGTEHETAYVETLKLKHKSLIDIAKVSDDRQERAAI